MAILLEWPFHYLVPLSIVIRTSLAIIFILTACQSDDRSVQKNDSCFSGDNIIELEFQNLIKSDSLSVIDFHYLYNGGGVGVADFNGDGHQDVFLGGNLVSCRLYSGDGAFSFTDVTAAAGLMTDVWVNGVSLVDINADGKKDIYLSVGGPDCQKAPCSNLLFINHSTETKFAFEEAADRYGLNLKGYSQQGLFFDADNDGDLDLYQVQNFVDPKSKNYPQPKRYFSKQSFDMFLENTFDATGQHSYEDRSEEWNVQLPGFGLGVAMTDFNEDGFLDLYIANDFITDDILYLNQEGKSFVDYSHKLLKHTSYNSMGVDIADVNGDALPDVMVVDMLPANNGRQKTMLGKMNYDKSLLSQKAGYNQQYIRNTVQLHNGQQGDSLSAFSDVSLLYGVHQTDWSWSPLMMDFDNDGDTDIYVSNGYGKNITDLDFVNYNAQAVAFGDKESFKKKMKAEVASLPDVSLPNLFFTRADNGTWKKITDFPPTITNGVAYADLDNDGDLDLVQNNINAKATILVNNTNKDSRHYLKLKLKGNVNNTDALGANVKVYLNNGNVISRRQSPVRSYLSSMSDELVIGLGTQEVDSLIIQWPGGKSSLLSQVERDTLMVIDQHLSTTPPHQKVLVNSYWTQSVVAERDENYSGLISHDFSKQPLLMKACYKDEIVMEEEVAGQGVYIANLQQALVELRPPYNTGSPQAIYDLPRMLVTDMLSQLVDGKKYLMLAGYREQSDSSILIVLQKEKDSQWTLKYQKELNAGRYTLIADNESDKGAYLTYYPSPQTYPATPQEKMYTIALGDQVKVAPFAAEAISGCPTAMLQVDLTGDGNKELAMIGEWMSPVILDASGKRMPSCLQSIEKVGKGMWQSLHAADLDGDGDQDLILGNIGQNTRFKMKEGKPMMIVSEDLDDNGRVDPLLSQYDETDSKLYCYHSKDDIAGQLPVIKKIYGDYASFASAAYSEVIAHLEKKSQPWTATTATSMVLENLGSCSFKIHNLPEEMQQSIINNIKTLDVNSDGLPDIIATTNVNAVETHNGAIDALNGITLVNEGNFTFKSISGDRSGYYVEEPSGSIIVLENGSFLVSSTEAIYFLKNNYE